MDTSVQWALRPDVHLYDWQLRAIEAFPANHRGVAKVVTGAGKTLFAIALAVKFQNEARGRFKLLVIVPSKVLQKQWVDEILRWTNVGVSEIGLLGSGHSDVLVGRNVVIAVVNSAIRNVDVINEMVKGCSKSLMILDECHRYLGQNYSQVLDIGCSARLGLSATPNPASYWPLEIMGGNQRIGDLFYELSYHDAIHDNCVSEFELIHVGFGLSARDRMRYDKITRQVENCRHGNSMSMLHFVGRRWNVLYANADRNSCAINLLSGLMARCPESRVLVFHERISSIDDFVRALADAGMQAVAVHSKKSDGENQNNIEAFRNGKVNVLVAGKALMEGFDVPAADVGLIVSATTSPIRVVQTFGRLLRRKDGGRTALIYRLFALDTVEEKVFKRVDFAKLAGLSRNRFLRFVESECGNCSFVEDDKRKLSVAGSELTQSCLSIGTVVQSRADGFYFSWQTDDQFVAARDNERYQITNQNEIRRVYDDNSLRKGVWYYCTDTGCVLIQTSCLDGRVRWCCCGRLAEGLLMKAVPLE